MPNPNPSIWNDDDSSEITAINFGTGDAGTYRELEAGKEYHIWNDKGMVLTSDNMTSVKATVRDSNGLEIENITVQKWVEVKSLTVHDGADGGDSSGVSDDNMSDFQPIGKEGYLGLGDIPPDCYRKVMIRVNIPTSALKAGVTFKIYITNQQPSSPIAKWITDLFGDGVTTLGNRLEVTDAAGADSDIEIESGWALINSKEIYKSIKETYTISTDAGVYKIYLTRDGVYSSTTGAIPANSILLAWVTIAGNVVTDVVDKREFIGQWVCPQHFQDLLAANPSGIHAAITGTGAIQNITAAITNPDYARNASILTTDVTSPSGDVKLIGIVRGKNDEEDITIVAGGTAYGNKPFETISKIVIPAGVTADDTVTVGFSDKIGLDNPIVIVGDVFKKKVNNEDKTSELSGKVSATYHTVDCATIVANEDMLLKYKSILTI
jgi:hypothetical protein